MTAGGAGPAVLAGARVVTPTEVLDPGWVHVHAGRIAAIGRHRPPPGLGPVRDLGGAWLLPGFVDLHCHGGAGHHFGTGRAGDRAAAALHLAHGTTTLLASLATDHVEAMAEAARSLADWLRPGPRHHEGPAEAADHPVVGVHLEGPFLAVAHCGAHDPARLLDPDLPVLDTLLAAGGGTVRSVTLAPERPGALALVDELVRRGVVAAVGHTAATYEEAAAAFARGAGLLTHAGNAMSAFHHRAPGPLLAAADAPAVTLEVIADGHHLHPATLAAVARLAPRRLALVTDAVAAAGHHDGPFRLGPVEVEVRHGAARTTSGALAGSTLTADRALRHAVDEVGLDVVAAVHAAATAPAAVLGLGGDRGSIAVGLRADLVECDDHLSVVGVHRPR